MRNRGLKRAPKKSSSNSKTRDLGNSFMVPGAPWLHSNRAIVPLMALGALLLCLVFFVKVSFSKESVLASESIVDQVYGVQVVNEFPHDPRAFTQGLLYGGKETLYESTGLNGRSSVRRVALRTGKVLDIHEMPNKFFGEGLTLLNDRLFQVTWLSKTGFIYDSSNLTNIGTFSNQMQDGWGLATDGKILFGSDGTSTLYHIDPKSFKVLKKLTVVYHGHQVYNLNELEYINGEVWANTWMTDCIARISAKDGRVLSWIYLPELRQRLEANGNTGIDVLNGIAWDQHTNRIFVTGKLWPKLYEIKLQRIKNPPKNGDIERFCVLPPYNFERS